jgi:hypothetical protein
MTPTDKKRRGGKKSLFNKLTPEQRVQLASWLTVENLTYKDARELVESQFGVSTSEDALVRFYSSFAVPWQYSQASDEAEAFGKLMEGNFDDATIRRAKQLAFSALTDRNPDVKTAKALLKIVGDSAKVDLAKERLTLDARKVALLEAKAALADRAKGIAGDSNLTEEQKGAQLRSLFGMG